MYITLSEAKKHLNLDEFFTDDDRYVLSLIEVAEDAVAGRINRPLASCVDPKTGYLFPSVSHAIKLLIGTYYSQREATAPQQIKEVPVAFDFLSDLNRRYTIV